MTNWEDTLLAQYANSPTIRALVGGFNDAIDPTADINAFYENIWNIDTASGYGLDVWGKIVGIGRYLQIPDEVDYFGFQTGGMPEKSKPFGSGVFYSGQESTKTYALSDSAYRSLILFKAFTNISSTDIQSLNKLVNKLFGGLHGFYVARGYVVEGYLTAGDIGRAFVEDLGNMEMRYVFEYDLNVYERAIINTPGLLPHPAGVKAYVG